MKTDQKRTADWLASPGLNLFDRRVVREVQVDESWVDRAGRAELAARATVVLEDGTWTRDCTVCQVTAYADWGWTEADSGIEAHADIDPACVVDALRLDVEGNPLGSVDVAELGDEVCDAIAQAIADAAAVEWQRLASEWQRDGGAR